MSGVRCAATGKGRERHQRYTSAVEPVVSMGLKTHVIIVDDGYSMSHRSCALSPVNVRSCMDKKFTLPDFLKLLTSNDVSVPQAMAIASKVSVSLEFM